MCRYDVSSQEFEHPLDYHITQDPAATKRAKWGHLGQACAEYPATDAQYGSVGATAPAHAPAARPAGLQGFQPMSREDMDKYEAEMKEWERQEAARQQSEEAQRKLSALLDGVDSLMPSEQARAGGDAGLEDGWKEAVDAASGRTYYYHEATGVSSWQRPQAADSVCVHSLSVGGCNISQIFFTRCVCAGAHERSLVERLHLVQHATYLPIHPHLYPHCCVCGREREKERERVSE